MRSWPRRHTAAFCNLMLADLPRFFKADGILKRRLRELGQNPPDADDSRCDLPMTTVRGLHGEGIEGIKGIEAKAERLLVSLSITVSVVFAGASLLAGTLVELPLALKTTVVLVLVLSVFYFLVAALCALKATGVAERYLVTIEDEAQGIEVREIVLMIDMNNQTATRKANLESVATDALRNGLVLLTVLIVLVTAGLAF